MWWGTKRIYLDYASATPVLSEALDAMSEASEKFGNPGAIHLEGVEAEKSLQESREKIAFELSAKAREIVFVSGGTEANNLATLGFARKLACQGVALTSTHWIVSSIEHPSVLECFGEIERLGGQVSHVDPDSRGVITPEAVVQKIKENTVFISIGLANHEIGVVQPIRDIVRAVREKNPNIVVHVDAGQAPLYLSPQVHTLDVDLLSLDSGKLYGPRGIGALYVSNRAELAPILLGGGQERGLRAGTENVALAAGFAAAFVQVSKERNGETRRLEKMRENFASEILAHIPDAVINADIKRSLPHILNISIPNIQSEYVTLALDRAGIAISTKSACKEGEERRSHVVDALGGRDFRAANTLRFSFGRDTSARDLQKTVAELVNILAKTK